ncbi:hypothetical protein VH88_15205 [Brevundimonas sp. KM4]|nr:hypothetical protein VH88_15205 [Brevundimonas sp. KM4]
MNDDDLLFPMDDLERWKRRELPQDWLAQRQEILIARLRAQAAELQRLGTSGNARFSPRPPPA